MSNPCPNCDKRERNCPPSPLCDHPCEQWAEEAIDAAEWVGCKGDYVGHHEPDPDAPLTGYALRDDYLAGHPSWQWPPKGAKP